MITFSNIGKLGKLGNQMFQYAALYGAAFTRGYKFAIPKNSDLERAFKLPSKSYLKDDVKQFLYREQDFHFNPNLWMIDDNTELYGYFQSDQYWHHCEAQIRKEFEFHDMIQAKANLWLNKNNLEDKLLINVHVRRTDYLEKPDYHPVLREDYYEKASNIVNSNLHTIAPGQEPVYLVFSDDTEWCKNKYPGVLIVEGNEDVVDMCLMSKCQLHVIANSSFSWWGSFLSGSEAVIAPNEWFGPAGPKNWESIYRKQWVRI